MSDRVLVTGGAGFVGSATALSLAAQGREVIALDNLKRRGSELNLPRLRAGGVAFVHGDVREPDDLAQLGPLDAVVECSAEPSVLAGRDGSPGYVVQANLTGAWHCLELARREDAQFVFLSTSRVYPVAQLTALALEHTASRFEIADGQAVAGASREGIAEDFPLEGARTLYGTTKLSAELLVAEYRDAYGLRAVVDRCGVIAGPWQMGKVDQGVFTYWVLAHLFDWPLSYIGFGGSGRQVRDLLHVDDLVELLTEQLDRPEHWDGETVNVGGGREGSLSLAETTELCASITGRELDVAVAGEDRPGDVPVYLSDCRRLHRKTEWRPHRDPEAVLRDIFEWAREHEQAVRAALGRD